MYIINIDLNIYPDFVTFSISKLDYISPTEKSFVILNEISYIKKLNLP